MFFEESIALNIISTFNSGLDTFISFLIIAILPNILWYLFQIALALLSSFQNKF